MCVVEIKTHGLQKRYVVIDDEGNLNEAEIKTIHVPDTIDVSSGLIDAIVAYVGRVHTTADVGANHLFLKLHGEQAGQTMTYADVDSLFRRLRRNRGDMRDAAYPPS
jgi:hypothetical protein